MMQSLAVIRTGLEGSQTKMDVISNNLANINTTGFKKMRPIFHDLLYQNQTQAGGFTSQATNYPSGLQQGTGANVVATEPVVTQGSLEQTNNALDMAINGQGYFQILLPSGQLAYTRDGSFQMSPQGQIVTALGNQLQPPITIPRGAQSITVGLDGTVSVTLQGQAQPSQVGLVQLANFINPAGLQNMGNNLATQTQASGAAITGQPTQNGLGSVAQGYLEGSNVSVVDEMIDMIATQRAYELNTEAAIVRNLNAIGATSSDLIAILQALKQSGSLHARIKVI
jgi:flagellar basal-body rod protein FlgG